MQANIPFMDWFIVSLPRALQLVTQLQLLPMKHVISTILEVGDMCLGKIKLLMSIDSGYIVTVLISSYLK